VDLQGTPLTIIRNSVKSKLTSSIPAPSILEFKVSVLHLFTTSEGIKYELLNNTKVERILPTLLLAQSTKTLSLVLKTASCPGEAEELQLNGNNDDGFSWIRLQNMGHYCQSCH
jgi:hypothetical protein